MPLPKDPGRQVKLPKTIYGNRYQVLAVLGVGSYAEVYSVVDLKVKSGTKKSTKLALKRIGFDEGEKEGEAMKEARMLAELDHPNVLKLLDSFKDGSYLCLITDLCQGGTLRDMVEGFQKSMGSFTEKQILCYCAQLLSAVAYIHSKKILHRDIKCPNIFMSELKDPDSHLLKLGDFGISRMLFSSTEKASTMIGTPYYISPEMFKTGKCDRKTDIWAFGCVLYELVYLRQPFYPADNMMQLIHRIVTKPLTYENWIYSDDLRTLCQNCFEKDPSDRPEATDVLNSTCLQNHTSNHSELHQDATETSKSADKSKRKTWAKPVPFKLFAHLTIEEKDEPIDDRNTPATIMGSAYEVVELVSSNSPAKPPIRSGVSPPRDAPPSPQKEHIPPEHLDTKADNHAYELTKDLHRQEDVQSYEPIDLTKIKLHKAHHETTGSDKRGSGETGSGSSHSEPSKRTKQKQESRRQHHSSRQRIRSHRKDRPSQTILVDSAAISKLIDAQQASNRQTNEPNKVDHLQNPKVKVQIKRKKALYTTVTSILCIILAASTATGAYYMAYSCDHPDCPAC